MKTLFATGIFVPDIGGPASYSRLVASELSKIVDTEIVTYSDVREYSDDKFLNFKVHRVWRKWPWFARHILYFAKVFFRSKHFDVLFALNTLNAGISCYIASRVFQKKFYIRIVGDYAWQVAQEKEKTYLGIDEFQKSGKKGKIKRLYDLQAWICGKADKVLVPSEYFKDVVCGWGISERKIKVIYNGVDFRPARVEKEEARKEIGISGNIILSVGRLVPWKGFRMLIKIMPRIIKTDQFARLVIVGDGPDRNMLEMMVKNLGLEKKVYLVGSKSKEELAVYLAACDMFVLNTGYEGFSHQILEAMLTETPIITTNIGGNKEIMRHGENGLVVDYNDEEGLLAAIKIFREKPEVVKKIMLSAKKTVACFSSEKMIEETINFLMNNV